MGAAVGSSVSKKPVLSRHSVSFVGRSPSGGKIKECSVGSPKDVNGKIEDCKNRVEDENKNNCIMVKQASAGGAEEVQKCPKLTAHYRSINWWWRRSLENPK